MNILTLPVGHYDANCYIVWDISPKATVIDPGGQPDLILTTLRENGLTLAMMLLTHAHFDHYLAAAPIQRETGVPVWLHRLDMVGWDNRHRPADLRALEDGDTPSLDGVPVLSVWHTPGHSPGSCCFVCQQALFSGDTLFRGDIGRVDLPGGSAEDMRRTLAAIATREDDFDVYPGHGEPTTLRWEQRGNPYLQAPYNL